MTNRMTASFSFTLTKITNASHYPDEYLFSRFDQYDCLFIIVDFDNTYPAKDSDKYAYGLESCTDSHCDDQTINQEDRVKRS